MAVLAPNATVAAQWVEEICQSTDPETITKIITSGNGLQFRKHPSGRVRTLNTEEFSGQWPEDVRYVWKEGDKRASKAIIIMSIVQDWLPASRENYDTLLHWWQFYPLVGLINPVFHPRRARCTHNF